VQRSARPGGDTLLDAFGNHSVAVEGDSLLSDLYLMNAFGGQLREGALKEHWGKYRIVETPTPGLLISSWRPGMAVKEDARDLADALEPIADTMIRDGALAAVFAKYGLTRRRMSEATPGCRRRTIRGFGKGGVSIQGGHGRVRLYGTTRRDFANVAKLPELVHKTQALVLKKTHQFDGCFCKALVSKQQHEHDESDDNAD
jgi:hypothetical protein